MELVGADEKSVTSYQYDAYGNTTITGKQTTTNELAYTGGVYDKTTEEYYLNARYYDPKDGRFLTQDTYRGEETDASTWNLYSYCGGNPVNYVDPSGHKRVTRKYLYEVKKHKAYALRKGKRHIVEYFSGNMDVDIDGSKKWKSSTYQPQTSMTINKGRNYLNPDKVPFIVIPPEHRKKSIISGPGSVCIVYDIKTKKYCYAIVGDRGPSGKIGEASPAVFQKLGHSFFNSKNKQYYGQGKESETRFKYIISAKYTLGSRYSGTQKNLLNYINVKGRKLKKELKMMGYTLKGLPL